MSEVWALLEKGGIEMSIALKLIKGSKKRCSFCGYNGIKSALEIHHIDGNHKNNTPENLLVLCTICHRESHEKQKIGYYLFERISVDGTITNNNINIEKIRCPRCGSGQIYNRKKTKTARCFSCGCVWRDEPRDSSRT